MDQAFITQLKGYGLTTSEILYHLPDHPSILQTFLWQDYDLFPTFPRLRGFLHFWETKLEGKLYSVRVAHRKLVKPADIKLVDVRFQLK